MRICFFYGMLHEDVSILALVIRHASGVSSAPCCTVICRLPTLQNFSTLSLKRQDLREKGIELKIWFSLQFLSESFLILRKIQRDIINVYKSSCKFQYISNKMQRSTVYLYLETALHVSGGTPTHHQERIQPYLQHLVFVTPLLLSATIVEELELCDKYQML